MYTHSNRQQKKDSFTGEAKRDYKDQKNNLKIGKCTDAIRPAYYYEVHNLENSSPVVDPSVFLAVKTFALPITAYFSFGLKHQTT